MEMKDTNNSNFSLPLFHGTNSETLKLDAEEIKELRNECKVLAHVLYKALISNGFSPNIIKCNTLEDFKKKQKKQLNGNLYSLKICIMMLYSVCHIMKIW